MYKKILHRLVFSSQIHLISQKILNAGLQFLIVILIARNLGAVEAGEYALVQSYIMPVIFLSSLALSQQILIDNNNTYQVKDFFFTRICCSLVLLTLVFAALSFFEEGYILVLAIIFGFVKLVDSCFDLSNSVLQKNKKTYWIAVLTISRVVLSIIVFYIMLEWYQNLNLAFGCVLLIMLIHFFVLDLRIIYGLSVNKTRIAPTRFFKLSKAALTRKKTLVKVGLPLGLSVLVGALQNSVIRIFLEQFRGAVELGQFSVTNQIIMVGNLVVTAIALNYLPELSRYFKNGNIAKFRKLIRLFVIIICSISTSGFCLSYFIGDKILTLIFGDEFQNLGGLMMFASLSAFPLFLNSILTTTAISVKLTYKVLKIYLVGSIPVVAVCYFSIPVYGFYGAFLALGVSNLVQVVYLYISIIKSLSVRTDLPQMTNSKD